MILTEEHKPIYKKAEAFANQFDHWFDVYVSAQEKKIHFVSALWDSKTYSVRSGGKRFRPFLTSLVYQIWNQDLEKIKSFCLAIEMIHTYSLVHDDLPCMDNDDLRRGKPTNHKVHGEAIALLAGDALVSEAFALISHDLSLPAETVVKIVRMLADKIGSFGMVGGQALDMNSTPAITITELEEIHLLKTGYLIQAAALGGAIISGANETQLKAISDFALNLGLAFQIKDDLLDENDKQQDYKSYLAVLGKEKTLAELNKKSNLAKEQLTLLNSDKTQSLIDLIDYNLQRVL
ncbi:MAG: polyprenyl synthetase family protein [Bdellovibrio sp.]|nr:polyprenyl synthetase family protein [Bdellovibrio sp.]